MKLHERLRESFQKCLRVPEGQVAPVAIIWTDATGEWLALAPLLRAAIPEFFAYGDYQPETRTGPAIWLKCIVDRMLPEAPPNGTTPILYLPNVSRQTLRAAVDCPPQLAPLIELQYRGRVWHQSNGRDWTVPAFLTSAEGLGLDVAQDKRTEEALGRALTLLADADLKSFAGRRLDADDFDRLSVADPIRDLLQWLNSPELFEQSQAARWEAFRNRCRAEFHIDPNDGPEPAVRGIAEARHELDSVWHRFCDTPSAYPGVTKLLRSPASLAIDASRNPAINDSYEAELKKAIQALGSLEHKAASQKVFALEEEHKDRRQWVWARTEQSPWAMSLEPLVTLSKLSQLPIGGASVDAAATAYASGGYRCDEAALDALSRFRETTPESVIMKKAVRALYEPWLDSSARHFQGLVQKAGKITSAPIIGERDVCVLFVDGLRFDVGAGLAAELEQRGYIIKQGFRLSTLPTVTATAKPAIMKVAGEFHGESSEDFAPTLGVKTASAPVLRAAMAQVGVEILAGSEKLFPNGTERGGWAEFGQIDHYGHEHPDDLARRVNTEIFNVADRVGQLLDAGWKQVRIVTDHGWLLLPDGLPKVDLPAFLAETKWSRCAVVKGEAAVPSYPWQWNSEVRIASPPGVACFRSGEKYTHGGVSLQECVVPDILVTAGGKATSASVVSIDWRGMRCKIKVESNDTSVVVDLRTNWKQPTSSIVATPKKIGDSGEVNLVVVDDQHEGAAAMVVLLDSSGSILDQKTTSVGEKA
jgi:hypothetical protein